MVLIPSTLRHFVLALHRVAILGTACVLLCQGDALGQTDSTPIKELAAQVQAFVSQASGERLLKEADIDELLFGCVDAALKIPPGQYSELTAVLDKMEPASFFVSMRVLPSDNVILRENWFWHRFDHTKEFFEACEKRMRSSGSFRVKMAFYVRWTDGLNIPDRLDKKPEEALGDFCQLASNFIHAKLDNKTEERIGATHRFSRTIIATLFSAEFDATTDLGPNSAFARSFRTSRFIVGPDGFWKPSDSGSSGSVAAVMKLRAEPGGTVSNAEYEELAAAPLLPLLSRPLMPSSECDSRLRRILERYPDL